MSTHRGTRSTRTVFTHSTSISSALLMCQPNEAHFELCTVLREYSEYPGESTQSTPGGDLRATTRPAPGYCEYSQRELRVLTGVLAVLTVPRETGPPKRIGPAPLPEVSSPSSSTLKLRGALVALPAEYPVSSLSPQ